jgi:hypothetical protein
MFAIFGGIDYPLTRHVDFRVIELGYGSVTTQNSFIQRGPIPIGSSRMLQVSSGIVFRFLVPGGPPKEKKRSY